MIAIPAIDLRDGACVQLVGGSFDDEKVRLDDVPGVAQRWRNAGFRHLHVVDLDAAMGTGSNEAVVEELLRDQEIDVQVGGGVRSEERIDDLLRAGAARVVTGTRALEDSWWIAEQARRWPDRLVVAVDVKNGKPVVRGWTQAARMDLRDVLRELSEIPLAGILVTAVDVEGQMRGPDLSLVDEVLDLSDLPLIASGGITSIDDLRDLNDRGVWGAVIGMALYAGSLNPYEVAEEFGG